MVGIYRIYVSELEFSFLSEMRYNEKSQDYEYVEHINGVGKLRDERRTSELLIDGKKYLDGLNMYFSIYPWDPYPLIDADNRQTRRELDFPTQTFVSKIMGTVDYQRNDDDGLKSGLYSGIFIGGKQFEELWTSCKQGRKIEWFSIDVFGDAMLEKQSIGIITYHWDHGEGRRHDLFLCGFSFRCK